MVGAVLCRRGPQAQRDLPHRRRLRAVPVDRAARSLVNPALGARSPTSAACSCRRPAGGRSAPSSPAWARDDKYEQNAKSAALFTNNTWHATDALDLTLGLRYTHEDKELDSATAIRTAASAARRCWAPAARGRRRRRWLARGVPGAAASAGRSSRQVDRLHAACRGRTRCTTAAPPTRSARRRNGPARSRRPTAGTST